MVPVTRLPVCCSRAPLRFPCAPHLGRAVPPDSVRSLVRPGGVQLGRPPQPDHTRTAMRCAQLSGGVRRAMPKAYHDPVKRLPAMSTSDSVGSQAACHGLVQVAAQPCAAWCDKEPLVGITHLPAHPVGEHQSGQRKRAGDGDAVAEMFVTAEYQWLHSCTISEWMQILPPSQSVISTSLSAAWSNSKPE